MPKPVEPALKLAVQTRYLQGYKPQQIADELGVKPQTIKTWAMRGGWVHAVANVNAKAGVVIAEAKMEGIEQALEANGSATRKALAGLLARSMAKIEQMPMETGKAALKVNQELEPLVRNAKTVFGWSDSQAQPLVRIAILSASGLAPLTPPDTSPAGYVPDVVPAQPVIDLVPDKVEVPQAEDNKELL